MTTFDRVITVGERLGVPTLFYLLLALGVYLVVRWLGARLVDVGHFFAPLIKGAFSQLDTMSAGQSQIKEIFGEIRDWLRNCPPPNGSGQAATS